MRRAPLVALCTALSIALLVAIVENFGLGSKTLLGFWDCVFTPGPAPYTLRASGVVPGGAAALGGLHDGDTIDLRKLKMSARGALLFQGIAGRTYDLPVERSGGTVLARVRPTTTYEINATEKTVGTLLFLFASALGIICAWLVTFRARRQAESLLLCLMLIAVFSTVLNPSSVALSYAPATALQYLIYGLSYTLPSVLTILLARRFGARGIVRRVLEGVGLTAAIAVFGASALAAIGIASLVVDPSPFVLGVTFLAITPVPSFLAFVVGVYATITSERMLRSRCAWLTLPRIAGVAGSLVCNVGEAYTTTWQVYVAFSIASSTFLLTGAVAVTYAVLQRRVLDIGFVLNRAFVFAGTSVVIVASFVLLEWALGTFLSDASHATGVVANAGLALVLGLSMSFIHRRVDSFVDFVFFHRRHEHEQALRNFAKAAAFATDVDALLDLAIARMREHTGAIELAILIECEGGYRAERSFGDDPPLFVDVNDAAVLAMKATMKPLDPHREQSALRSDLVVPMGARGRLVGAIACGARESGESYAPDEIDALVEFASGIAAAYDALAHDKAERHRDDEIVEELRALRLALERR